MQVTLMMVASLDGRTTNGNTAGTNPWASAEDQAVFSAQIAAHDCIVMGSATYEAARAIIQPTPDKPRIVLTRTPQKWTKEFRPGLTFSALATQEIVAQAERDGHKSLLLVGGAHTNARFLDAGLVDELLITIEPALFGAGTPLVASLQRTVQLQLLSSKQLNPKGTLLLHYRIVKNETKE